MCVDWLFNEKLAGQLMSMGFAINSYDMCVAKKLLMEVNAL